MSTLKVPVGPSDHVQGDDDAGMHAGRVWGL